MDFGICMFVTDYSMAATDLAIAVEERGFDALFIPDHTHMPASRDSDFRMSKSMPDDYTRNLDMFMALSAAAAVTKRIRLGTGICLVVERDPIVTAKEVASLDQLSGGRVDFGVGGGWNREELENHGVDWHRRFKVMRERIEAMQAIWTQDEGLLQRRIREFRQDLVMAETGAEAASADFRRRRRATHPATRIALWRRLGADAGRGHR